jgi:hypothetical protein
MKRVFSISLFLFLYGFTIILNHCIRSSKTLPLPSFSYFGFAPIVADAYWLKLLTSQNELSDQSFFDYAQYITDLDPHFTTVYRYAAIYLMTQRQRYDLATALLEKSLLSTVNANDRRIHLYLAYSSYNFQCDAKNMNSNVNSI